MKADFEKFVDALGLDYFRGAELWTYFSKERNRVANSPPPVEMWRNIVRTLAVAEIMRRQFGKCTVLSSYRSSAYNQAVGGAAMSCHKRFQALDLEFVNGDSVQWGRFAEALRGEEIFEGRGPRFVFRGGVGTYPTFVHIDTRGRDATW